MSSVPPKVQQQLGMLQQIQQQLQTVAGQKAQYEMAVKETNRAVEELKEVSDESPVYVNVGTVMMQKEKEIGRNGLQLSLVSHTCLRPVGSSRPILSGGILPGRGEHPE